MGIIIKETKTMKITLKELREIIKEEIQSLKENEERQDNFIEYMAKKFKGTNIMGFKFSYDKMSGTFSWDNGYKQIMATPFWDGRNQLPINVMDDAGDDIAAKTFKFNPSYDVKALEREYLKILLPFIKRYK